MRSSQAVGEVLTYRISLWQGNLIVLDSAGALVLHSPLCSHDYSEVTFTGYRARETFYKAVDKGEYKYSSKN